MNLQTKHVNLRNPLAPRICDTVNVTCQTYRHPGIQNEPAKRKCDLIRFPNVHKLQTPGIILPMKTNQPSLMFQQLCILINAAVSWKALLQAGCQTHSHENCHVLCTFLFSVSHLKIHQNAWPKLESTAWWGARWGHTLYPLVNHTKSYWTLPFIVDFPVQNGDFP